MSQASSGTSAARDYARLLSLAVHEFRTPASVVGGYLRMLQRDHDEPLSDRQRKMVEEAEKSCARIVALVNELSEISKLDSGVLQLEQKPMDLFETVAAVAESVHEARDREVRVIVRGDATTAPIEGDGVRLRHAIAAFLRAILREQPPGATVVVERRRLAVAAGETAVVVLANEADVPKAYTAPAAPLDEKRGGLGLALPIARRVVERHGGEVQSPSLSAGEGPGRTAITVRIPIRESPR